MITPKRSLPFLFIVIAFFSCSDDENDIKISDKACYTSKMIYRELTCIYNRNDKNEIVSIDYISTDGSNYTGKSTIEYDANGRLAKVRNASSDYVYEYNADGTLHVEKLYSRDTNPIILFVEKFLKYDKNGQLVLVVSEFKHYPEIRYERYEYNADGNIIKVYNSNNGTDEVLMEEYLSFDKNKYTLINQPFDHTTILMSEGISGAISRLRTKNWVNNPTVIKLTGNNSQPTNISYTYNEFGYPTEGRGASYEYNCQ